MIIAHQEVGDQREINRNRGAEAVPTTPDCSKDRSNVPGYLFRVFVTGRFCPSLVAVVGTQTRSPWPFFTPDILGRLMRF